MLNESRIVKLPKSCMWNKNTFKNFYKVRTRLNQILEFNKIKQFRPRNVTKNDTISS